MIGFHRPGRVRGSVLLASQGAAARPSISSESALHAACRGEAAPAAAASPCLSAAAAPSNMQARSGSFRRHRWSLASLLVLLCWCSMSRWGILFAMRSDTAPPGLGRFRADRRPGRGQRGRKEELRNRPVVDEEVDLWNLEHIEDDDLDDGHGTPEIVAKPKRQERRPQDIPGYFNRRDLERLDMSQLDNRGELQQLSLEELEARVSRKSGRVVARTPVKPDAPAKGIATKQREADTLQTDSDEGQEDLPRKPALRSTWGSYPPALRPDSAVSGDVVPGNQEAPFKGRSRDVPKKKRPRSLDGWLMSKGLGSKDRKKLATYDEDEVDEVPEGTTSVYVKKLRAFMRKLLPLPWERVEGPQSWSDPSDQSWQDLGLHGRACQDVFRELERLGVHAPNYLQAAAVPPLLAGKDALLSSMTGSGKTFSFLLPLLSAHVLPLAKQSLARKIDRSLPVHKIKKVRVMPTLLVLSPGRELAVQTHNIIVELLKPFQELNCTLLIGGASHGTQDEVMKRRLPSVIVATPGRLLDHIMEGRLELHKLKAVVIDEVDALLSISRSDQVELLLGQLSNATGAQRVLASATGATSKNTSDFANSFLRGNWSAIGPTSSVELPTRVLHLVKDCPDIDRKFQFLKRLVQSHPAPLGILVFCNNNKRSQKVCSHLKFNGFSAAMISGNRSKQSRQRAIQWMENGDLDILVATDVAARGLDFKEITHVVNFELPGDYAGYAHRAGRCGRMGRNGIVISLASGGTKNVRMTRMSQDLGFELFEGNIVNMQLGVVEMGAVRERVGTAGSLPPAEAAPGVW